VDEFRGTPHEPGIYNDPENWRGAFLELAIELGPRDNSRLRGAVAACWSHPRLLGPLFDPRTHEPFRPIEDVMGQDGGWNWSAAGQLRLDEAIVGCATYAIRDPRVDWLDLSIPVGMLELAYDVTYPLTRESNAWLASVDLVLAAIGDHVASHVPYELALIGEEVLGAWSSDPDDRGAIMREQIEKYGGALIGRRLWNRLDPSVPSVQLSSGLRYVPASW
jgi:hypothetical protein